MAQTKEEILIQLQLKYKADQAEKSLSEVDKLMKSIAESTDNSTEALEKFADGLAEIDRKEKELAESQEKLRKEQEKYEASQKRLDGTVKTFAGGISLATGALGAFGIQSKDATAALQKVQSAMAISQGLKDLREGFKDLGTSFSGLAKVIFANPIFLIGAVIAAVGVAILKFTGALDYLIGWFTQVFKVVDKLLFKFKDWIAAIFGSTEATKEGRMSQKEYNDTIESGTKLLESRNSQLELYNKAADIQYKLAAAQGASEEELFNIKLKTLKQNYEEAKAQLAVADSIRARLAAAGQLGYITKEQQKQYDELKLKVANTGLEILTLTKDYNDKTAEANKKAADEAKARTDKQNAETAKTTKDEQDKALKALEAELARRNTLFEEEYLIKERNLKQQFIDGEIETEKELTQKLLDVDIDRAQKKQSQLEANQALISTYQGITEEARKNLEIKTDEEITKAKEEQFNKQVEDRKKAIEKEKELLADKLENIDNKYEKDIDALQDKRKMRESDRILATLDLEKRALLEKQLLYKQDSEEYIKLQEELAKKDVEINRARIDQKEQDEQTVKDAAKEAFGQAVGIAEAITQVRLNSINREIAAAKKAGKETEDLEKRKYEIEKKAFNRGKAVRIAEVVQTTAQAAIQAFNSLVGIIPIGPTIAPIAAGIAAAFGAAQIAAISSEQFPPFEGGSPTVPPTPSAPGTATISGGGAAAPTFGGGQFFGLGQTQLPSTSGKESMKVYVTETDIRNTSNKVKVIEDRATIG